LKVHILTSIMPTDYISTHTTSTEPFVEINLFAGTFSVFLCDGKTDNIIDWRRITMCGEAERITPLILCGCRKRRLY
jgi:hypothetical protein